MHDVIIVGGGPVGFVTALGLARAGVRVLVLEAEPAVIESPRAAVYHWSMLDGLERLGIREEAETIGFTKDDYLWFVKATGERIEYDISVVGRVTPFNYNIQLGQHQLAKICQARLAALANAEVRFGARVEALAQDADGATVTLVGGETLRARWVVGADGAGSLTRNALGLPFEGFTWPERFVATNLYHDFESSGYLQSNMVIDPQWGAVIVKIARDGLWRCTFMEDASLPAESFRERLRRLTSICCRERAATRWTPPRPIRCTSAARRASARAACCSRATPRTSPIPPAGSASPPGCSTPTRCGRRSPPWCSKAPIRRCSTAGARNGGRCSSTGPARRRPPTSASCSMPAGEARSWRPRSEACARWRAIPMCASSG